MTYRKRQTNKQSLYETTRWKKVRKLIIARDPVCHWCKSKPSTVADHLAHSKGDERFFDESNLVGSCWSCNAARAGKKRAMMHAPAPTPRTKARAEANELIDNMFARLMGTRGKPDG